MRVPRFFLLAVLIASSAEGQPKADGRVVNDDGTPIAGARIDAFGRENAEELGRRQARGGVRVPLATVKSAADGSFRLGLKPRSIVLQATAEGYAPGAVTVEEGVATLLSLRQASLKRGVITAGGRPVAGAQVTWISVEGAEQHATTGQDGAFQSPDPAVAAARLIVLHKDYAPKQAFAAGRDAVRGLDQKLEAGVVVRGSTVDRATGKPMSGVEVWVDDTWPLSQTDATGAFSIPHAPADWATVTARTRQVIGSARRRAGSVVIALNPGRTLSGTVVDAGTRLPLEGVTVTVTTGWGSSSAADTNPRGQYTITGLPAGRYQPQLERAGYSPGADASRTIDLRSALRETFDAQLTRVPRLEGRVVDEQHRPIEGALVGLGYNETPNIYSAMWMNSGGGSTRTDEDGAFRLSVPADDEAVPGMPSVLRNRPLVVLKQGFAAATVALAPAAPKGAPVVVTLMRGIELRGRVTNKEGAPIAGAEVNVAEDGSVGGSLMPTHAVISSLDEKGWTRSDEAGWFVVRVNDRLHHVAVRRTGFAPGLAKRHDPRNSAPLEVVLESAVTLRGRISRADGRGVEGVQTSVVSPNPMSGSMGATATTTVEGDFEITGLSPGVYRFSAQHDAMGISETRTVEVPGSDLEVVLPPTVTLKGQVLDAATRKPVPRFTITAQAENRPSSRQVESEDGTGAFTFADLSTGAVTLTVIAEGYAAETVADITLDEGLDPAPVEIVLDADTPIRGRVTDGANAPIADVTVSVERAPGGESAATSSTQADETGEYELRGLIAGEATLGFSAPGYAKEQRTIDTLRVSRLDVVLKRGLSLKGEVVGASGAGVEDAFVNARSSTQGATDQSVQTGDRGRFTIEGLVPGRYTVSANTVDHGSAKLEDVDVETAGPLRLVLEQEKTAVLTGRVTGLPEGEDAEMSVVMAVNEETGSSSQATLDASQSFRMEDAPTGRVRVRAIAASLSTGATRMSRSVDLTLAPGSQTSTVLEFSNDITISGTVRRDGAFVPYANVTFTGGPDQDTSARTDAHGAYRAVGVEPGRYKVQVRGDDVTFTTPYVVEASGTLDIDITGGAIAGRIVRADGGTPIPGVEVSLFRIGVDENTPATSVVTSGQGAFLQRALPEGPYRIITSKPGFGQEVLEVEVSRAQTVEANLELKPAEGLHVIVVDARDQRPLDAIVVVRDSARRIVANRHSGLGADGALNIPLASGSYSLSTSATGYGTATIKVTAPGPQLRIGLTPGGTLVIESTRDLRGRVRLVQPDGEEYIRCWCNGIADIELKGKRTVVENVAPGTYRLELVDEPGATPQTVLVTDGQISTVVIP
ncbi:MAG: carboxypeptidase regulatory-like domain-containing protein [Vicinamibacteria bacterium]|nr:carboxypeptidase regulatory-like domain-containing protein [Vicinamibacteria bacterium]